MCWRHFQPPGDPYTELGLAFPVASWPEAWAQISAIACGALDALREEIHA